MSENRIVFSTPWFSVEEITTSHHDLPWYRINRNGGVLVIPMTPAGDYILIKQFRPSAGLRTIEMPSGEIDAGELPEQAAARELLEETGYRTGRLDSLGPIRVMPNRYGVIDHVFLARDCVPTSATSEIGIDVLVLSPQQLRNAVDAGEIDDLCLFGALWLAERFLAADQGNP